MRSRLKYGNKITEVHGIKFRSKGEAQRYEILRASESFGIIWQLRLQVKHDLICNGEKVGTYTSDYEYYEQKERSRESVFIIEDYKGARTPLFTLKWNILKSMYASGLEDGTVQFRLTGRGSNKRRPSSLREISASKKKAKKVRKA